MKNGGDYMKEVDLYRLLTRVGGGGQDSNGIKIIQVVTTEPDPYTFVFEGSNLALDAGLFEIPVSLYPLRRGDRLFVFPLIGKGVGQRWAVLEKLNGGVTLGIMQSSTSVKIDGIDKEYGAAELIIPPYFSVSNAIGTDPEEGHPYLLPADIRPLQAGDMVSLAPAMAGGVVKYVILERY